MFCSSAYVIVLISKRLTAGHAESNASGDTSSAARRSAQEPAEEDAIHRATSVGILSVNEEEDVKASLERNVWPAHGSTPGPGNRNFSVRTGFVKRSGRPAAGPGHGIFSRFEVNQVREYGKCGRWGFLWGRWGAGSRREETTEGLAAVRRRRPTMQGNEVTWRQVCWLFS